ncbi:ATP-binding protein [Nonomuraea sp. NN258]|uniref:ATP-binding protein n=1 Tax=Nonomuraea antri TaxID=2730852 RepID=UPI001C2BB94B|nr:ATP-binding protein [Nonomuraea antri]NRQ38087.1 ATP-binding protein [Nonomuraea antri]
MRLGSSEANAVIYPEPPMAQVQEIGVIQLRHNDQAPYLAREAVRIWLGAEHPAHEIAVLAASELVTNAVRYAGTSSADATSFPIMLRLSQRQEYLRLTVTDPGSSCSEPARIPLQAPSLYSERGRGLAIVENLSRNRWGSYRLLASGHRVIWCHLDLNPTPAQLAELFHTTV